jgi:hypothetical protein
MICRDCLNKENYRPGILLDIARAQRKSFSKGCKNGYTDEQIKTLKDDLICTLRDSKSGLQKYTLNIYITILSSALHSRNYCDSRIKVIEDALKKTDC